MTSCEGSNNDNEKFDWQEFKQKFLPVILALLGLVIYEIYNTLHK